DTLGRAINTDPKRLLQVINNLLSNAFKFTEKGSVRLHAQVAETGWTLGHPILDKAPVVGRSQVETPGIAFLRARRRIFSEASRKAVAAPEPNTAARAWDLPS